MWTTKCAERRRERQKNDPSWRERKNKYQREYYNKRRADPTFCVGVTNYNREYALRRKYNMTKEEWVVLFETQGRRCACCGASDAGAKGGWSTDHDHDTGRVRGILCHRCNKVLGFLGDNAAGVQAAATKFLNYLQGSQSNNAAAPDET